MESTPGHVGSSRPRILIVEDDPAVRRSLLLLLQGRNFDVRAHATGPTLLADAARQAPDCVIADYVLEDGDGIAMLRALRRQGWDGPAILVSAFASEALALDAREVGFTQVFEKPLREGALIEAVSRLTRRPADHSG